MGKINVPRLHAPTDGEKLKASVINTWLSRCEDAFEGHEDTTGDTLKVKDRILQASLAVDDPTVAAWWTENRTELKALATWEAFVAKVRERFVPSNWRIDGLEAFYAVRQGAAEPFPAFTARLQDARNTLAGAGEGYAVTDAIMKNHLLFNSHIRLRKRVLAQAEFKFHNLKVDGLINAMMTQWAVMVEDGVAPGIRPSTRAASSTVPSSAAPALPPLTDADRDRLRDLKGCFHCRQHPGTPGWKQHTARECPGDATRGIPPRGGATVAAVTFSDAALAGAEDDPNPYTVASVYCRSESPAALWTTGILGDGTDSEGEREWD